MWGIGPTHLVQVSGGPFLIRRWPLQRYLLAPPFVLQNKKLSIHRESLIGTVTLRNRTTFWRSLQTFRNRREGRPGHVWHAHQAAPMICYYIRRTIPRASIRSVGRSTVDRSDCRKGCVHQSSLDPPHSTHHAAFDGSLNDQYIFHSFYMLICLSP